MSSPLRPALFFGPRLNTVQRLLLVQLAGILGGCQPAPSAAKGADVSVRPIAVRTAPVIREEAPVPIRVNGTIGAKEESRLAFKIGGVLDHISVEEGDRVRRGQVLAMLKRSEIDAQVAQANAAYDKASRDLERVKKLEEAKVATREQLENVNTALEVARSQREIATFNQRYATIVAPTSGRILKRLASESELVGAGMPVLVLSSSEKGWIMRASVTDREVVRISPGDPAEFVLDALPGETVSAKVGEIASAPSPLTGTFEVELALARPPERLITGLFGKGYITPTKAERRTRIPASAIVEGDGARAAVFVLGEDRQHARRIELVVQAIEPDSIVIAQGLEGIDEVVTDGSAYLDERVPVKVVAGAER